MIAAYQAKLTTAPPETTTNARTPGRARSEAGTASAARSAIAGSTPIPIAKAPPAQLPYSTIRPFHAVVATSHSFDRWPRNATTATTAPMPSTTAPAQSQRDHDSRQRRHRRGAPAERQEPERERAEQGCELRANEDGEDARAEREQESPAAGVVDRPDHEPQRERRGRVGPGLLDEDGGVGERRRGDRRDRGEVGPAGGDDPPGQEVGREDRPGHHERLNRLDRLVGARDGVQPPERRREPGDEAREAVRLASAGGVTGLRDRTRDLGRLELVGEDRRRLSPPRLPRVDRREEEVGPDEGDEHLDTRASVRLRARPRERRGRDVRAHSAIARVGVGAGWARSRTTRCGTPAASHTWATLSSRSAGASGMVTTSSSARVASRAASASPRGPEHGDSLHAPAAEPRVVVQEPDDVDVRGSAKVAHDAAPRLPRTHDENAPAPVVGAASGLGHEADEPARDDGERRGDHAVDREDARREVAEVARRDDDPERGQRGESRGECDRREVACSRVAPRPAIHTGQDVHDVRRPEDDRQGRQERPPLELGALPVDEQQVRAQERPAHERRVDEQLDEPPRLDRDGVTKPRVAGTSAPLLLRELGEEAPELHEQREGDEHAESRDGRPVEHVVGDGCRPERDRDEGEQRHGLGLREAVVDETVRRVVLPALGHGAPLGEPPDGDEGRVEDRDREHQERQQHGRHRRPRRGPARRQAERREEEPQELAPRVAHEHLRAARTEVEGKEAEACEREREREHEDEVVLVDRRRVDREVEARHRRERRGEAVHVVEEVERVRDADEPEERDDDTEDVVRDELDPQARSDRDRRGSELGDELRDRAQVTHVVDEPGREDDPAACQDPGELPRRIQGADRDGQRDAGCQPARDADPAERRRCPLVPALSRGQRDEPGRGGGANEGPEGERRDRQGGDRDGRFHGALKGSGQLPGPYALRPRERRREPTGPLQSRPMSVYADLVRHRELFGSLFRRDLRAKYKGSFLGLAWTLALPAALMLVYLVVFAVLWKAQPTETDDYWLFLLCGLPPWVFFATSLQSGARSIVENAPIIRKVRFPRQLVPLSVVATEVVAFAAMTAIVLGLALWFRPESRDVAWAAIPVAAVIVVFVAGLALALASLNAIFRDVEFVVAALLLPWFFLTPILYQLDDLPGADSRPWLIDLLHWGNPLTPAIESYRAPLYGGELPPLADALYLCVAALVALALGAFVFNAVDDRIASEA